MSFIVSELPALCYFGEKCVHSKPTPLCGRVQIIRGKYSLEIAGGL